MFGILFTALIYQWASYVLWFETLNIFIALFIATVVRFAVRNMTIRYVGIFQVIEFWIVLLTVLGQLLICVGAPPHLINYAKFPGIVERG